VEPPSRNAIQHYDVQLKLNGAPCGQPLTFTPRTGGTGDPMTFKIIDLKPGTEYQWRACAVGPAGAGRWSPFHKLTTTKHVPKAPVPVHDSSRSSAFSDGSLTVYWETAAKGHVDETDVKEFKVLVDGQKYQNVPATQHSITIDKLAPGSKHKVAIITVNYAGESDPCVIDRQMPDEGAVDITAKETELCKLKELDSAHGDTVVDALSLKFNNVNDSDIFSCTHMYNCGLPTKLECGYPVINVEKPYRCWRFAWEQGPGGNGAKWKGNSQTNGRIDGWLRVKALKRHVEGWVGKIRKLENELANLKEKRRRLFKEARRQYVDPMVDQ